MTPVSFAKLLLRMLAAGIMLIYLPPPVALGSSALIAEFQRNGGLAWNALPEETLWLMVMFVLIFTSSVFIWLYADWLAQKFLPSGVSSSQAPDYEEWQHWGLVLLGGWLALKACLGAQQALFGNAVYVGDARLLPFNAIAAIILITDWKYLGKVFGPARKHPSP